MSDQVVYRFNGFRLDAARRLLFSADGQLIPLKPKVFATLLYLVERPGELVNKEALIAAVWPHVVVEENNLNKAISTLRQVFGETRDEHRFIVTEPGRGYRFVASVDAVPETVPISSLAGAATPSDRRGSMSRHRSNVSQTGDMVAAGGVNLPERDDNDIEPHPHTREPRNIEPQRRRPVFAAGILATFALAAVGVYWLAPSQTKTVDSDAHTPVPNSIAVLPFRNLSPDPEDAYFAIGIHEEMLSQLTQVGDLHVASGTSVQSYAGTQKTTPEIARELAVETVLDGSVRYADGRVLVTAHLSDGATNGTLWSESYDYEFSDIFAIQSKIAINVARALKAELLPAELERVTRLPTTSVRAYDLYLSAIARGRRQTRAESALAIEEVDQALELDPGFALAWARKSSLETNAQYYDPEHGAQHRALGEQAARRALDLDPLLGSAYVALAFALATRPDFTAAEAAYRRAFELNSTLGRPNSYAVMQLSLANFAHARDISHEVRDLRGLGSTELRFLMLTNAYLGDWPTVVQQWDLGMRLFTPWREAENVMRHLRVGRNELEEARALAPADPINAAMIANLDSPQTALLELRRLYAAAGEDANAALTVGLWAGHFGDTTLALEAMRSAINGQPGQAAYLWLPQLREMRQLPQFRAFLREVGMVDYWETYGWSDICRRRSNDDDFDCD